MTGFSVYQVAFNQNKRKPLCVSNTTQKENVVYAAARCTAGFIFIRHRADCRENGVGAKKKDFRVARQFSDQNK